MAKKSTKQISPSTVAQNTALDLAVSMGWRNVSMTDIAEASGLALADLLRLYPTKSAIIGGLVDRTDEAMLNALPADGHKDPVRDRLFDLMMSRFDTLTGYRDGLIAVTKAELRDPMTSLCHLIRFQRSLTLMSEAAGLSTSGLIGKLRLKALALVYANATRVWIKDDSADLAKTMAAVDQGLAKAEKLASYCWPAKHDVEGSPEPAT